MPKRNDIETILVIGSGPIVIGQACEFDYSGTQACKVLKDEGFRGGAGQLQPGDHHDRSRPWPIEPTSSPSPPSSSSGSSLASIRMRFCPPWAGKPA